MSFCWKNLLFIVGFSLSFEDQCSGSEHLDENISGSSSTPTFSRKIEEISHDENLLKDICASILSRKQDIVRLKEKLNRDHSEEKYVLWRKHATGEEIDKTSLNKNEKDVVRSKKRSYLKNAVINDIQKIGLEAVHIGKAELVDNKSQGGYAIQITYNYPNAGVYCYKTEKQNSIIENLSPTKIIFGFSVDDIINNILNGKSWNKEVDGYPATVYTE